MERQSISWRWTLPVFLLAAVLYIIGLNDTTLWADEGWTIAASAEPNPFAVVSDWVIEDVHPPLYFMTLNIYRAFTGDTIFELRMFSVFVSLLGVAVMYRLGKSLFSTRAGIYAALFYAMHDLVRVLTQEVRHYPGQMLLTTLALWLYWRFYQHPTRGRGGAFVLAGAALLYTHYWGGFILLALALHSLITIMPKRDIPSSTRHPLRPYLIAFIAIALLYLPWLPALYNQITLERPGGLPHALQNNQTVYAVLTYQLIGIPELFWVMLAGVGALGAFIAQPRRWWPSYATLTPLLAALIPPVLSILVNTAYPTLSFRALAIVVPPVILLTAHGLARFRSREQMALLAFILAFGLSTTSAQPVIRAPWPQIATYLAAHTAPGDLVLMENDTDADPFIYYLDAAGVPAIYSQRQRERAQVEANPDAYTQFMASNLADVNGVWVVKLGWPGLEGEYDMRGELQFLGWQLTTPEIDTYGLYIDRPIFLWRLDRPPGPDAEAITTYGQNLRLLRAEAFTHQAGVSLNMLWSPITTPTQEYTVSVLLFDEAGNVVTNVDARPLDGLSPTSTWQPNGLYFDSRSLAADLTPGTYTLAVQIYYFVDGEGAVLEHATADDCSDDERCYFVAVETITIE